MSDANKYKAKVFISCGMANKKEKGFANKLKSLFEGQGYNAFIAMEQQTLHGVNECLIKELKYADYYVFADLKREEFKKTKERRGSLYTHQELACACVLEFKEVLYIKQKGVKSEGLIKYWLCNPIEIDRLDLDKKKKEEIENKIAGLGWDPKRSRHLQIQLKLDKSPVQYTDHVGTYCQLVVKAEVENLRTDIPAKNCVAVLWKIQDKDGKVIEHHDKSHLKWADTKAYMGFVREKDSSDVCLFAVNWHDQRQIYLQSERDHTPRVPILKEEGVYSLTYRIYADEFPMREVSVELKLCETWNSNNVRLIS